jgi:hypothetical protein
MNLLNKNIAIRQRLEIFRLDTLASILEHEQNGPYYLALANLLRFELPYLEGEREIDGHSVFQYGAYLVHLLSAQNDREGLDQLVKMGSEGIGSELQNKVIEHQQKKKKKKSKIG